MIEFPRGPRGLQPGEKAYTGLECPRCGYPETKDYGGYDYQPAFDDKLGGPPDPRIHYLGCGRCGKGFDVIDEDDWEANPVPARCNGHIHEFRSPEDLDEWVTKGCTFGRRAP